MSNFVEIFRKNFMAFRKEAQKFRNDRRCSR